MFMQSRYTYSIVDGYVMNVVGEAWCFLLHIDKNCREALIILQVFDFLQSSSATSSKSACCVVLG